MAYVQVETGVKRIKDVSVQRFDGRPTEQMITLEDGTRWFRLVRDSDGLRDDYLPWPEPVIGAFASVDQVPYVYKATICDEHGTPVRELGDDYKAHPGSTFSVVYR